MSYFVYVREAETGKIVRFGAYDEPPYIVSKDGKNFVEVFPHDLSELGKQES